MIIVNIIINIICICFLEYGWFERSAVETQLTKTFALVGGPIYVDLRADDVSKRHEHLSQLRISKLLRKMVDKQVATFRT